MRHRLKCNIPGLVLFLALTLSGSVWAAPVLKNANLPGDIYAGQKAQLKLTFEWPAKEGEYEIKSSENIDLNNIKLLAVGQSQETYETNSGPVSRVVLIYQLLPMKMGQGTINGFNVLYRKPNAENWKTIKVPTIFMDIKSALPLKQVLILISILFVIVLPFALWVIYASRRERKLEKIFESDPKQQFYAAAAEKFSSFVTGYTDALLRELLSGWSAEFMKVVMTCYDIPLRPVTKSEILKELRGRSIPAGELQEIENIFSWLEHLKFSTKDATSTELEKIRLSLLHYVKGKIIIGNL